MGAAGPTTGCGVGAAKRPSSCLAWGELGKSGGFMFFIFAVFGGAVRTRRRWGNAAVLAELSRPASSRKAWTGLGRDCCWFSPCKIDARAQGKPCSVGHTACGTASLAKEQRPLPSPLSSASSSNALAKLPQRLRLEEGNDAGCEREAHGGCRGREMCPGCAHGVAPLPALPRRHGQGWLQMGKPL